MRFFLAIVRRILSMVVTLIGVSIIIFVVLRLLPGNAVTAALGVSIGLLTKGQVAALNHYYGARSARLPAVLVAAACPLVGTSASRSSLASRSPR